MKTRHDTTAVGAETPEKNRKMNQREKDGLAKRLMKGVGSSAMLGFVTVKAISKINGK